MKKVFSLLMVMALALLMLVGCGGSDSSAQTSGSASGSTSQDGGAVVEGYPTEIDMDEEPYTVAIQVVTLPGVQFEGKAEREEAINAITLPAINVKVEIQEVWINEVVNTTSMAVAGNEKIDLVHVATVNPLSSLVGSDILLDMNTDNLLQNRGQDLVALFGELLEAGSVNGQQLAVPAKVFNASSKGIMYNKDMTDQAGITVPETLDMDGLEEILYAFKDANPDVMPFYIGNGELNFLYWLQGYEGFGSEASYGAILNASQELKVGNLYASEMFKEFCLRMYQWRVDGIIPGDPTDTNPSQTYLAAGQLLTGVIDINPTYRSQYDSSNDFTVGYTELVPASITNSSITEYMWGIASSCQRPDKAMDFLNFLYSNADVANILKYGLDGVNYEFQAGSDTVIESNNTYSPIFYFAGNSAEMYVVAPADESMIEQSVTLENEATISPVCYYMFNDTEFQTESSVISATILEYLPRLQNGMADSEEATLALIDEFNAKLSASGIDDVIAANQSQLEAWLATQ